MKKLLRTLVILILLVAAFFVIKTQTTRLGSPTMTIANPASIYCQEQGGRLEIITDASGAQVGMCHLPDDRICEEWAYFRGTCEDQTPGSVYDFQSCVDANNPIMESYPRQCRANGQTFVEDIQADDEENTVMCTMEYAPVCALVQIQCIKDPCEPIQQTFGNACQMNANKLASFLHDGECTE